MDCSTPCLRVLQHLSEFAQTHVHWVGDAIQTSHPVAPFYSCPQTFPASGSFPMSQLFASGGQNIGVSASASILPMNIQDWFLLGLTGLVSLQTKGLSRVFSNTTVQKHQFFSTHSAFFMIQLSHTYMTTGKTIAFTRRTFVDKVMSLLFNMLSRLVMEKAMAPHSSTLAWKIPWMEEPGRLQSMLRVGHDWATSLSLFTFMHWRRKWQLTPVFLPRESHREPGELPSMGSHRVRHDWSDLAAAGWS